MKTQNKNFKTGKLITLTFIALATGTSVFAQPKPDENANMEVDLAMERLDSLMASTVIAAKYEAPSLMEDEIYSAYHRLDLLAEKMEVELKYEAPGMERVIAEEESIENNREINTKPDNFLTFIQHLIKKTE